ncbi:DUF721 domain-containing protein [Thalassotalea sp. PLHSN55]|uniref:DUF721 domain-containing protein n=1 Tax=Thalassotalea sp. PLHSN55 TaxID=3435888 RepID=UPI003F864228
MAKKSKLPKDMSALFNSSKGTLAQIASKTNSLTILADIVRQICPDLPEDVWHIANFRQNTLVIEVKSPVWSQRLQFERNNICQALIEQTENQFNQIEIKVSPYRNKASSVTPAQKPVSSTSTQLSKQTAEQLREVAQSAPEGLKRTLERLAQLGDKN